MRTKIKMKDFCCLTNKVADMEMDKVADMMVDEWTALNLFSNSYLRKISLSSRLG